MATSRTYDDHGTLSGIELRVKGVITWSQRLTRDSVGRITAQRDSGAVTGVVVTGYRYDAQDRLDQVTKDGVPVQAFSFDAAGNRTAVTTSAGIVAATYASDDRILSYDGQPITHDASGARASEVRGADTLRYHLLHDQLGSVRQVIDVASGAVAQAVDYDVNGVVTRNTSAGFQPFGYAGGLNDADGRTVHFGVRDYDQRAGRWIQPDPVGVAGGPNRYVYAGADPINFTDPSGKGPLGASLGAI